MATRWCRKMHALTAALLALLCNALVSATPYSKCAFTGALVDVRLNDCSQLPCPIPLGSTVNMVVDFKAVWGITHMSSVVFGLLDNIPLFIHENGQVCHALLTGSCPATTGAALSYSTSFNVSSGLPPLDITIEWQIRDQTEKVVLCAQIPAYLTTEVQQLDWWFFHSRSRLLGK